MAPNTQNEESDMLNLQLLDSLLNSDKLNEGVMSPMMPIYSENEQSFFDNLLFGAPMGCTDFIDIFLKRPIKPAEKFVLPSILQSP